MDGKRMYLHSIEIPSQYDFTFNEPFTVVRLYRPNYIDYFPAAAFCRSSDCYAVAPADIFGLIYQPQLSRPGAAVRFIADDVFTPLIVVATHNVSPPVVDAWPHVGLF